MARRFLLLILALSNLICSFVKGAGPKASTTSSTLLPIATDGSDCSHNVKGANISACYFTLTNIPRCARGCLVNVTLMTPCESTDIKCLCAHSSSIQQSAVPCLTEACGVVDTQTTINYYFHLCKSANFPLSEDPISTMAAWSTVATTESTAARATTSPASSPPSRNYQGSLSLSTTAKVGLGVGAAVGGLAIVVLLSMYLSQRKSKRRRRPPRKGPNTQGATESSAKRKKYQSSEKNGIHTYQKGRVELPSDPPRAQASIQCHEPGQAQRSFDAETNWI